MGTKLKSITLINVYFAESGYGDRLETPPLGLGYISEYLNTKNVDNSIIDMGLGFTNKQIIQRRVQHNMKTMEEQNISRQQEQGQHKDILKWPAGRFKQFLTNDRNE